MAIDPLDRDYQGPGVFSHTVTEKNDFGGPGRAGACGVNMGDGIVCLRQVELEDFRHGVTVPSQRGYSSPPVTGTVTV